MEIVLTIIGILILLVMIIFSEPGIAFIDFCFRKYLKSKGRLEELGELEDNEDIPRFCTFAKTSLERKVQAALLIFTLISSGLMLWVYFSYANR